MKTYECHKRVKAEQVTYSCKPDIFAATYEAVTE